MLLGLEDAEVVAGHGGHAGVVEQAVDELGSVAGEPVAARVDVERSLRRDGHVEPELASSAHEQVASIPESTPALTNSDL